ncbi:MAG: hypothetical protein ACLGIR_11535 [Actinomycetes bacterium]
MSPERQLTLGVAVLLGGSVAAGLVALSPVGPLVAASVVALRALVGGAWLLAVGTRDRHRAVAARLAADPVLDHLVRARFGDGHEGATAVLAAYAERPGITHEVLRECVARASDLDDLHVLLDLALRTRDP